MADVHTAKVRSFNMSQIKAKNTKPEIAVRKALFSTGLRYRVNDRKLPGTPDIVLKKYKTVVFVNGCFWHGHEGCNKFRIPKTRTEWWEKKISQNISRDERTKRSLEEKNWQVIIIWECSLDLLNISNAIKTIKSNENLAPF
jgi:DNA mismatch endonuclease (patch repair protein)